MPESFALVWRLGLFYDHTVDLPVVRDNGQKRTPRLWSTRTTLQRVQNVFQPIIDIMHRKGRSGYVQSNNRRPVVLGRTVLCLRSCRVFVPKDRVF